MLRNTVTGERNDRRNTSGGSNWIHAENSLDPGWRYGAARGTHGALVDGMKFNVMVSVTDSAKTTESRSTIRARNLQVAVERAMKPYNDSDHIGTHPYTSGGMVGRVIMVGMGARKPEGYRERIVQVFVCQSVE